MIFAQRRNKIFVDIGDFLQWTKKMKSHTDFEESSNRRDHVSVCKLWSYA